MALVVFATDYVNYPCILGCPSPGIRFFWSLDHCLIAEKTTGYYCISGCISNMFIIQKGWVFPKGAQCWPVFYWQAGQSFADYLQEIDLFYVGADLITLKWFNKVFYKFQVTVLYVCMYVCQISTIAYKNASWKISNLSQISCMKDWK